MSDKTILIDGPAGKLELVVSNSDVATTPSEALEQSVPVVICCHPHPLYGGTLTNKVVHSLAKAFTALGCIAVRFNFRGIGQSEGQYDDGVGEGEDLLAVFDWVKTTYPDSQIDLAGFSFGAYIALQQHQRIKPKRLVIVAPPVDMFNKIQAIQVATPDWLLLQGEEDEVVECDSVRKWYAEQTKSGQALWFAETGHFFHGKLNQLQQGIIDTWS